MRALMSWRFGAALLAAAVYGCGSPGTSRDAAVPPGEIDRTVLPVPEPSFAPARELDVRKAKAPPRFEVKAPTGAPNVLLVLIDDFGFGQASTFGGGVNFPTLERLSREIPALQEHFHRIMSREIVRDHGVMLLLGSMRAEERLAAFLLNLSQRFATRGYSSTEYNLRMTREEIGSYLGLKLETISRVLSRFQEEGLIEVRNKYLKLIDVERLREVVGGRTTG